MTSTPSSSDRRASRRVSSITTPSRAGSRLSGNRKLLKRTRDLPDNEPQSRARAADLSTRTWRGTAGSLGGIAPEPYRGAIGGCRGYLPGVPPYWERCHGRRVGAVKERPMNRLRLVPPMIALGLIATVGAAWADQSPFAGRWRWNRTQSTVQPNEPLPKDIVTEIASADPSRIRWSVTIVDPTDKRH